MPARVIRGEINSSRSLERVSMMADLAFRALLVVVDDYGRFDGRMHILRNSMFPTRPEVTEAKLTKWLDELEREDCIRRYMVNGDPYIELPTWEKHRGKGRRAEKSKYPENLSPRKSEDFPGIPGNPRSERITRDEGIGTGGELPASPDPDALGAIALPEPKRSRHKTEAPADLEDGDKIALMVWCREKHPELASKQRLRELVDACLDWHRAEGKLRASWLDACRSWVRKQAVMDRDKPKSRGFNPPTARYVETAEETRRARIEAYRDYEREAGDFVPIGNVLSIVDSLGGRKA